MKRGLTRKKLAGLLGHATTSQLCRWEEGIQVPSLPNALRLSALLNMPVEFLFKGLHDEVVADAVTRRRHDDAEAAGAEVDRAEPIAIIEYDAEDH